MTESAYLPGQCNLGRAEIRLRYLLGWLGLAATGSLLAALFWFQISDLWRLTAFFPAFGAALGFLQARQHFCVAYGLQGTCDPALQRGAGTPAGPAEFLPQDRSKAWKILGQAAAVAAVLTAATLAIPG